MHARLATLTLVCMMGLHAHQAFAARTSVIYGEDNRVDYYAASIFQPLAASTVALMRASTLTEQGGITQINTVPYGSGMGLCPDEPFYHQETAAFCSGFLVAPDLIVTAGHCVRTEQACQNTRFVFGFRLDTPQSRPRSVPAEQVFACKQLIHSVADSAGEDFAVVRIDRPVSHVAPLEYRTAGKIAVGESLTVAGHPAGLPLKVAGGASVRALMSQYLIANLDTYGGNSGSAVFNSVTGKVEGILVRGEMDYTYANGCRTSNKCADGGCRGEDVTLFERVLPYLPK